MAFSFSEQDPAVVIREDERMALSVTRHAQNPIAEDFRYLACNIDTLDIGFYVDWGPTWNRTRNFFQEKKDKAEEIKEVLDESPDGRCFLHLPTGKKPNYRFHLAFPEYHMYIAISQKAERSPNVYVSINSTTLWNLGEEKSIKLVQDDIKSFHGTVHRALPSRCDIAVDFLLPNGLTFDFIEEHRVSRSHDTRPVIKNGQLETYYLGGDKSPIKLRIYDKKKEVLKHGTKLWFFSLWDVDQSADVWRVEFQLRRQVLKQFHINSTEDLDEKIGGVWRYLTKHWFSLRARDNEKAERRTVLKWWQDVQECSYLLGPAINLERQFAPEAMASTKWYVAHMAGCVPSYAARLGINDLGDALDKLMIDIYKTWRTRKFREEFIKKSIKLGKAVDINGGDHGKE